MIGVFLAPLKPAHRYMEENGSAAMLAAKRLVGVAPEVNLREHVAHIPLSNMNKASRSGLKPRDVTRSTKRWYQWPHKKDLCPPKSF